MTMAGSSEKTNDLRKGTEEVSSDPNMWGMFIHFSQLLIILFFPFSLIVPIILWRTKKKESDIIDQHGRVVANWVLTELILCIFILPLCVSLTKVGVPLLFALLIIGIVFSIIGAIKAKSGVIWKYPLSIAFFSIKEKGEKAMDATPRQRIGSISELARSVCIILLVLYAVIGFLSYFDMLIDTPLGVNVYIDELVGVKPISALSDTGKIVDMVALLLAYWMILKGFYHLQKLFQCYKRGRIFTTEANKQIRKIGIIVCLYPVIIHLVYWLERIAVFLSFETGTTDFMVPHTETLISYIQIIITGASIICVSWVLEWGREMHEDKELTI